MLFYIKASIFYDLRVYLFNFIAYYAYFYESILVLSESKADIRNPLSLLAYSAFKWSIHQSMMIVICLRP